MSINERLFKIMTQKNVKAAELAEHLQVTKSVISNWKNRGTNPPAEYIIPICELLAITPEYLLTGEEKKTISENEEEMLQLFRKLPDREQIKYIGRLEDAANAYTRNTERSSDSKVG